MATLLASALEAIRASGKRRGTIRVHAANHDGCTLVEVTHDGCAVAPDLRPGAVEGPPPEDLVALRKQARQVGGEFLVDSDGAHTTLRLILPAAEHRDVAPLPSGWSHFKASKL
jgi:hypothetical protein